MRPTLHRFLASRLQMHRVHGSTCRLGDPVADSYDRILPFLGESILNFRLIEQALHVRERSLTN